MTGTGRSGGMRRRDSQEFFGFPFKGRVFFFRVYVHFHRMYRYCLILQEKSFRAFLPFWRLAKPSLLLEGLLQHRGGLCWVCWGRCGRLTGRGLVFQRGQLFFHVPLRLRCYAGLYIIRGVLVGNQRCRGFLQRRNTY